MDSSCESIPPGRDRFRRRLLPVPSPPRESRGRRRRRLVLAFQMPFVTWGPSEYTGVCRKSPVGLVVVAPRVVRARAVVVALIPAAPPAPAVTAPVVVPAIVVGDDRRRRGRRRDRCHRRPRP